jgi:hypothetical protein
MRRALPRWIIPGRSATSPASSLSLSARSSLTDLVCRYLYIFVFSSVKFISYPFFFMSWMVSLRLPISLFSSAMASARSTETLGLA